MAEIVLSLDHLHKLAFDVLASNGLSACQSDAMAKVLVAGQRDDCQSHWCMAPYWVRKDAEEGQNQR